MQRTTLIASVAISSLLVAGIAWAGSAVRDDGLDTDPTATTDAAADSAPDDSRTPHDSPTPDDSRTPDDSSTLDDSRTPDDSPTPDDSSSPADDAPLTAPVVASHPALEAGSITVEAQGTTVRLLEAVAAEGWRRHVEVAEGLEVEVTFRRDGARVDVKAEVDDGQLRFRVRDRRTDERTETFVARDGTFSTDDDDRSGSSDGDGDDDDRSGSHDSDDDRSGSGDDDDAGDDRSGSGDDDDAGDDRSDDDSDD